MDDDWKKGLIPLGPWVSFVSANMQKLKENSINLIVILTIYISTLRALYTCVQVLTIVFVCRDTRLKILQY